MNYCLYEDERAIQLNPIALSRPAYDIHCGIFSFAERMKRQFPKGTWYFHARKYLSGCLRATKRASLPQRIESLKSVLFINGAQLLPLQEIKRMNSAKKDTLYVCKNIIVAAYLSGENLKGIRVADTIDLSGVKAKKVQIKTVRFDYLWKIIHHNGEQIAQDALAFPLGTIRGHISPSAVLEEKHRIYIGKGARIRSGVILNAEDGPVVIDDGAEIMPHAVIMGPSYIGKKSKVKIGAKIYEGTSIGPVCKVGGEIEESILHGYSNKQHEGFLGHAYLGMWCNLGADTNNSDLKNNYGTVDVYVNGKKVDSRETFVGLFMGDHSKSGINTMFNTGTVVGFCSNVFGAGYLPKSIPSFAWLDAQKGLQEYTLEKALDVAERVMARRDIRLSKSDRTLFKEIFVRTKAERNI